MRALTRQEWDPVNWDGSAWEGPEKVEDTDFLGATEVILPAGNFPSCSVGSPSSPEEANPVLMKQDNTDPPQDSPSTPTSASRPTTSLKSLKGPKGEVYSVTHKFSLISRDPMSKHRNGFYECGMMVAKTYTWIRLHLWAHEVGILKLVE